MVKKRLVQLARSLVARAFGREMVFLPLGARTNGQQVVFDLADGRALLPLRYTYRADAGGLVTYRIQEPGADLDYRLFAAAYTDDHRPTAGPPVLSFRLAAVDRGDRLCVSLLEPKAWRNDQPLVVTPAGPAAARKFIAALEATGPKGRLRRRCSHYLPYEQKPIGRDYYFGDDYVDYPRQKERWVAGTVERVRHYCPQGRLLEIGCALGLYLEAFVQAGFDAYGVDVSEFAVAEAGKRVGSDRVRRCDVDGEDWPFPGPFDAFVLFDVLEHSTHPRRLLEQITERSRPGAGLFVTTSNADSLTHRLFGPDWEGYTDYSHHGIDQITATTLPAWLGELGWRVERWECRDIWVEGADPAALRLREVFRSVPELSTLLAERDLGDAIFVAARKA